MRNLRVKAVISDHGESFFGEGTLLSEDMVEILNGEETAYYQEIYLR